MIFKPELIEKILAGEKTVTRRPERYRFLSSVAGGEVARIRRAEPCRYQEYRSYAIQPGRGKEAVGRIFIKSVATEPLGGGLDWTTSEAEREGFEGWPEFLAYWEKLYGYYDATQLVHRIEFELAGEG